MIKLSKIRQKTVVEQVMEKIKELIALGQYKVNDRIPTENELAKMFGIGRSSIREAIKIFNYLGVLESHPAKGTFVCDRSNISTEALTWSILLGKDELYELIEFRGAIELWSQIHLAQKYKEDPDSVAEILDALQLNIENMKKAIEQKDAAKLGLLDYDFHSIIIGGSGNAVFSSIYSVLRYFMREQIKKVHMNYEDLSSIVYNHQKIVEAVKTGDIVSAMEESREHIEATKERLRIGMKAIKGNK